jgi:hypothetical protein
LKLEEEIYWPLEEGVTKSLDMWVFGRFENEVLISLNEEGFWPLEKELFCLFE